MNKADMMMAYNENAFKNFDEQALVQCKNCLRTFLADRLAIHERSCKAGKPLKMRAGVEPKNEPELSAADRRILGKVAKPGDRATLKNSDLNSDIYRTETYAPEETKVVERALNGAPGGSYGKNVSFANEGAAIGSKDEKFPCKFCGTMLPPGKIFAHETSCSHKPAHAGIKS